MSQDKPKDGSPEASPGDLQAAWEASGQPTSGQPTFGDPTSPSSTDAPADEVVDPELVQLGRRRRRRHPLISVVVILMSLYAMYLVRADLSYFFQPRTPVDLGAVEDAVQGGRLQPNRFVTIRGAPDRKHALLLQRPVGGWDSFVRLLQAQDRLYVQRHRRSRTVEREVVGVHTGRLVRFSSLPYRDAVRAYLGKVIRPEHEIAPADVFRAKKEGRLELRDRKGRPVRVGENSEFWLNVSYPDEWVVQLAKAVHPTADDARRQLAELKLPYVLAPDDSKMFWRFVVLARGNDLEQLLRGFSDPGKNAGVIRRQVTYTARWSELRVDGDTLVVESDQRDLPGRYELVSGVEGGPPLAEQRDRPLRLPASALQHISTTSRFELPADAMVLVVRDQPDDYWLYLLLFSVLGLLILFNAFVLARRAREKTAT